MLCSVHRSALGKAAAAETAQGNCSTHPKFKQIRNPPFSILRSMLTDSHTPLGPLQPARLLLQHSITYPRTAQRGKHTALRPQRRFNALHADETVQGFACIGTWARRQHHQQHLRLRQHPSRRQTWVVPLLCISTTHASTLYAWWRGRPCPKPELKRGSGPAWEHARLLAWQMPSTYFAYSMVYVVSSAISGALTGLQQASIQWQQVR